MNLKEVVANDHLHWYSDIQDSLDDFPILLRREEWVKGTKFHKQPGIEIHITEAGESTLVVGKQVLPQAPRSVAIFHGSMPHQMISKSLYKRTVILVGLQDFPSPIGTPTLQQLIDFSWIPNSKCLSFSLRPKDFHELILHCSKLHDEMTNRHVGWEQMALSKLLGISALLQRALTVLEDDEGPHHDIQSCLVQDCCEYVCQHLGEDLSLRTMAKKLSISEEYLTRKFKREMGVSYYQYVLLQRVAEGKRLLRESPDYTISEIAYLTGFSSSSRFSEHFKLLTEETPSAYRLRIQT